MNQHLLDLYEHQIKNIEGSLYFGQRCDMDNPKEIAAMMYALGWSEGTKTEIAQAEKDRNFYLGIK
ncbi:MAG: hypothetical protein WC998_06830 [Candidatus Paceibacterota bacterium]|jgi:hypothetical protein